LTTPTAVAFRSKLPSHFEFDFIDAPIPCDPAPGTQVLFNSASHSAWWTSPGVDAIRASHTLLERQLLLHGPYDILMGFSQGCALISSYMLYHAREQPTQPLPFSAAIFICGGVPLPVLEDLDVDVPQRAKAINDLTSKMMKEKASALVELAANLDLIQPGIGLWDNVDGLLHNPKRMPDEKDVFGLDFTAMAAEVKIKIPTAHVFGAKDPRWPASVQLAFLCNNRRMYDHGGGHDIPRTTEGSMAIAGLGEGVAKAI